MEEIDTPKATAAYLRVPESTLAQWRHLGRGPKYMKLSSHVRYKRSDVDAWLEANTVLPHP